MNRYAVYVRKDNWKEYFHYIETLNGIKEVRNKYKNIYFSKTTKNWYKIDKEKNLEYLIKRVDK